MYECVCMSVCACVNVRCMLLFPSTSASTSAHLGCDGGEAAAEPVASLLMVGNQLGYRLEGNAYRNKTK